MHLSISSSDATGKRAGLDRFTIILLGAVFLGLLLTEAVTVVGFDRISKVQRRELGQRKALLPVRDVGSSETAHVAILGNSLLLEGVNVPLLETRVGTKYKPVPYFVLATNYYDWFFGLKRLFAEGMRPRYVLLGLSPNQLAFGGTRGDYSSRYLFQQSDLLDVVRQTHMDATTASGFLLAHYSEFYSTRELSRGFVLKLLLPSIEDLLHSRLGTSRDPEINRDELRALSADRLWALDQLCRANGANFVLVVPPSYQKGGETLLQAGRDRGVTVLVPVADGEFDTSYFESDGFHLNEKGAQVFTNKLATAMLETMLR
jgi:hypothetical protein